MLPSRLSLSLRHDGGDAGTGIEFAAGIGRQDVSELLASLDGSRVIGDGPGDWSLAAALAWDPASGARRSFSASMQHALGGSTSGGDPRAEMVHDTPGGMAWSAVPICNSGARM